MLTNKLLGKTRNIMSHQEQNFEKPEDEIGAISTGFDIPQMLQIIVSLFSIFFIVVCAMYFWKYDFLGDLSFFRGPLRQNSGHQACAGWRFKLFQGPITSK